jgi:aryl-alcohol dehydrogenase
VTGVVMGSADPQQFIPQLVELWRQRRLPFDRLITQYDLSAVNEAAADSARGATVKPVLLP